MFQLLEMTEVQVASVTNRTEAHGDERVPAVSIGIEIEAANTLLDIIDPKIREALYKAVDDQPELPGVEKSTPVLRCNAFERHTLATAYEGWTLAVDDGVDESNPMVFGSVKVDKFSVEAKQGGSVVLRFRAGTSDVDADKLGKLAMHNGQSIWITLTAPKPGAASIDGTQAAFDADHPDAGDLFSAGAENGKQPGGEETEAEQAEGGPQPDGSWPFPNRPNNSLEAPPQAATIERSQPGTRTARGREKTKAALAAGAEAAK